MATSFVTNSQKRCKCYHYPPPFSTPYDSNCTFGSTGISFHTEDLMTSSRFKTINLIHLPAPTTRCLWLNPEDHMISPEMLPSADITAFLVSHRALVHLALRGTDLPNDLPSFPHLRSFEGSFENSAIICGGHPPLGTLSIIFVLTYWSDDSFLPPFDAGPPTDQVHEAGGSVNDLAEQLSPTSLARLVSSFSNLAGLDVCISQPMVCTRRA
ncbi:hypothetical protein B0H14DRAFT_2826731 [Mycena olivaceomarginata]|nr:hypothetical protein B0H14DRAFT_2826731 [Mycena olivaceomarginata]